MERCCERDNDGDGNCDLHEEKGIYRIGKCPGHCPHETGHIKPMHPPLKVMLCCRCGAEGHAVPVRMVPNGHGPLAPKIIEYPESKIRWFNFRFDRR